MDELEKLNEQCMRCQEEAQKNFQTLNTNAFFDSTTLSFAFVKNN